MKFAKKLFALLMTVAVIFSLGVTASAAEAYKITINQSETDHTYAAYQIFVGDLSEGILSNIQWGSSVNATGKQAMGSASAKAELLDSSDAAAAFAAELADNGYLDAAAGTATYNDGKYEIGGLAAGYYLVMDTNSKLAAGEAMTKYILKVVENVTATPKNVGVPTVDKKITGEADDKVSEASIGDTVSFETTANIPADAANYNYYNFVINDTMSDGLSFDSDSVEVKINGVPVKSGVEYTLYSGSSADGNTFQIALKDAKGHAGEKVVVSYSATLTNKAVIAGDGNTNTTKVTYSNNPNYNYKQQDKPTSNDPTGETPESKTTTYTTGLTIHKVDGNLQALKGASFKISGNGVNIILVSHEVFSQDNSNGKYWKLNDGTFTTTDPATGAIAQDKYDSTLTKYKKSITFTPETHDEAYSVTAAVGDDGVLVFNGLGAGTYTIHEAVTPAGFNTIEDFDVEVSFDADNKEFTASATKGNSVTVDNNIVSMDIVNNSGATLPSTGGIGTTIFYVIGSILLVGAAVLLITRKRMGTKA